MKITIDTAEGTVTIHNRHLAMKCVDAVFADPEVIGLPGALPQEPLSPAHAVGPKHQKPAPEPQVKAKRQRTPEQRARMAEASRASWAKRRAAAGGGEQAKSDVNAKLEELKRKFAADRAALEEGAA